MNLEETFFKVLSLAVIYVGREQRRVNSCQSVLPTAG